MSDKCKSCEFPSVTQQAKNLSFSVYNVLIEALKTGEVTASEEVVQNRINTCKGCPFLNESRCSECGCFINVKAGLKAEKCPKGKW